MTTYAINLNLGSSTQPEASTPDTAEADEAATPFESWIDWLEETRETIDENDGDPEDLDTILAVVLEHVVGGGPDAVARKEERLEEVLRQVQAANNTITGFLHRQREARKTQKAEAVALAKRLDEMTGAIAAVTRDNVELTATLTACEQNLTQATGMLEKEIAKERSLRRLLDAQRSRPHTQTIASELAKRHAAKILEKSS